MLKYVVIGTVALMFAPDSFAGPDCAGFTRAIEASIKTAAFDYASTIGDNSAIRATNAQASIANEYAVAQMNLTLLIQNKCPLPERPLVIGAYLGDAIECRTALLRGQKDPPACDQVLWKPKYADSPRPAS